MKPNAPLPNTNPETGIAYGYIAANSLSQELLDELLYVHGENLSEAQALDAEKTRWMELEGHLNNFDEDKFLDDLQFEEPTIKGECDGVKYMTSWLGGALNLFIMESPVTGWYRECSICVPGAGNLDQPDGNIKCYDVPRGWMRSVEDGKPTNVIVHVSGGVLQVVYSDNENVRCRAIQLDQNEPTTPEQDEMFAEMQSMVGVF